MKRRIRDSFLIAIAIGVLFEARTRVHAATPRRTAATAAVQPPGGSTPSPTPTPTPISAPATLYVPGGLTADGVARRAEATSATVRVNEQERAVAQAGLDQALAGYLPRLSGVLRYTRLSPLDSSSLGNLVVAPSLAPGAIPAGTPVESLAVATLSFPVVRNQWTAQATLQVPLSDYILRIPQAEAAASGNVRAADLTVRAARLNIATEARIAYYAWVRARMQAEVTAQAIAQARAHLAEVTNAEQAGTASRADVLRVTSQLAAAELLDTRTRSLATLCEQQLHTLMHDDPGTRLEIGEDVVRAAATTGAQDGPDSDSDDVVGAADSALATLWEEARARRLEPRALAQSADALRHQARSVRASGLPRLDAVANVTSANPHPRVFPQQDKFTTTWDAGVQLSWTPTDTFGVEAARRATTARASALDAQQAALDDALRTQVTQSLQLAIDARSALETSERGLTAAEESYRVRRLLFLNGRATSVEQTDAETELTRARVEAVNARLDVVVARVRLRHAVGRDTDDSASR